MKKISMYSALFLLLAGMWLCGGEQVRAQEVQDRLRHANPLIVTVDKKTAPPESEDSNVVSFDRLLFWHLLYSPMDSLMSVDNEAKSFVAVMMNKTGCVNAAGIDSERAYEGMDALRELMQPMPMWQTNLPLLLAALGSDAVNARTAVDTEHGVYAIGDSVLARDHNWHRGGYGTLTPEECVRFRSTVGVIRLLDKAYGNDSRKLIYDVKAMGLGLPEMFHGESLPSLKLNEDAQHHNAGLAASREGCLSPLQVMTFFNGVANNGKMMAPETEDEETPQVLMPKMMSGRMLNFARKSLRASVESGLCKRFAIKGKKVMVLTSSIPQRDESRCLLVAIVMAEGQTFMMVTDVRADLRHEAYDHHVLLFQRMLSLPV